MEGKSTTKNRKSIIPAAATFSNPAAAGWLFKIMHEGWLRKRWRKRYCVLSNGILYFYEFKTSDGTEKTCNTLNLRHYGECAKASRKDCKKSPNTIILEPAKNTNSKDKNTSSSKQIQREYFYTETPEEQDEWVAKLQEALSFSSIGGTSKLEHVTKNRAKPPGRANGNRRPPTKQHLKERAMMAEVSLVEDLSQSNKENGVPKKRGHQPASALKPPPGGGNAKLSPKLPLKASLSNESSQSVEDDETDGMTLSPLPLTPKSPTPPPAALKPNSVKKTDSERILSTGSEDSKESSAATSSVTEEEHPETLTSTKDSPKSPSPAALIPPSTQHTPDFKSIDEHLPSPPPLPGSPEDPNCIINSEPEIAKENPKTPPPPSAALKPSIKKTSENLNNPVERTQSADSMGNQPSPPATPDEDQTRSLSSSRGSSLGKGDQIAEKLVSESDSPPGTLKSRSESQEDFATTPPPADKTEGDENVDETKVTSSSDVMVKAKSLTELDGDLPPPPDPPAEEKNGDAVKAEEKPTKPKNKKTKKGKKDKKVRPSSLEIEI